MHNREPLEFAERLFHLIQTVAVDSPQAARYLTQAFHTVENRPSTGGIAFSYLVDTLESLVFPASPEPSSEEDPSTTANGPQTVDDIPRTNSLNQNSSLYSRSEALSYLNAHIGLHFIALSQRKRFDLWTGLQNDLGLRQSAATPILIDLRKDVEDQMTSIERRAIAPEIDINLLKEGLHTYWNNTYLSVSATLRASIEPGTGRHEKGAIPRSDRFSRSSSLAHKRFSFQRILLFGVVLILGGVAAGWLYNYGLPEPPTRDIVSLSVLSSENMTSDFRTSAPEQAEHFIQDRFRIHLRIPRIRNADLIGVGSRTIQDKLEVPVILYHDDALDQEFPVFVYSYAFLNTNRQNIELARSILLRIEDESHFGVHYSGDGSALVWRDRDDIFMAVVQFDPAKLQERVEVL